MCQPASVSGCVQLAVGVLRWAWRASVCVNKWLWAVWAHLQRRWCVGWFWHTQDSTVQKVALPKQLVCKLNNDYILLQKMNLYEFQQCISYYLTNDGWLFFLQTAPLLRTKAYIWTGYLRVNRSSSHSVSVSQQVYWSQISQMDQNLKTGDCCFSSLDVKSQNSVTSWKFMRSFQRIQIKKSVYYYIWLSSYTFHVVICQ